MARKKQKRRNGIFAGVSAAVLMLAAAVILLLSYVSIVADPAKVWFFSIFGLMFFPALILNLAGLVWAAVRRSKLFLMPLLAILPSLIFVGRYVRLGGEDVSGDVSVHDEGGLRLVTYNVGRFACRRDGMSRNECVDSVFAYLRRQDADIICLQEYAAGNQTQLKSEIRSLMPGYGIEYYLFGERNSYFGNVTLSRIPAVGRGKLLFENSANLALYTEYAFNGRRFRVYNCHFESYAISMTSIWKSMTGDRDAFRNTENKYRRSIIRRPKQVGDVLSHIEKSPVEAIVCGDFNDNPMSYTYYRMDRGLKDSFTEAGHGFGASYSAFWPMLRIDYVFIPDSWRAAGHRTEKVKYSDHYPVVTELVPE